MDFGAGWGGDFGWVRLQSAAVIDAPLQGGWETVGRVLSEVALVAAVCDRRGECEAMEWPDSGVG